MLQRDNILYPHNFNFRNSFTTCIDSIKYKST